jgi:hypothetical protein
MCGIEWKSEKRPQDDVAKHHQMSGATRMGSAFRRASSPCAEKPGNASLMTAHSAGAGQAFNQGTT